MSTETTELTGIFQGDLIIRTAIMAALEDIRRNPYLLDYVFASLKYDDLTKKQYGAADIERAKAWFLKNRITVALALKLEPTQLPAISISLRESVEENPTLGDKHYKVSEDIPADSSFQWTNIAGPFDAVSYNTTTGLITVPSEISENLSIFTGMLLVLKTGETLEILDVLEDGLVVAPDLDVDMSGMVIRAIPPSNVALLESVFSKETYLIGVHVQGEPIYALYLWSILKFALYRYKQAYLEARNFERSVMSSTDFAQNEAMGVENVYSRWISLTGYTKDVWPKQFTTKYTGVITQLRIMDTEKLWPEDTAEELQNRPYIGMDDEDPWPI